MKNRLKYEFKKLRGAIREVMQFAKGRMWSKSKTRSMRDATDLNWQIVPVPLVPIMETLIPLLYLQPNYIL